MPEEQQTPEERLLKLIRRKDVAGGTVVAKKSMLNPFGPFLKTFSVDIFPFLEKLLILVCAVLTAAIVYELIFEKKDVQVLYKQKQNSSEEIFRPVTISQPKPYSVYREEVTKRDIFQSPLFQGAKTENPNPSGASSVPELTKNLKLVGIILDNVSEAIIEDIDAGQTFFLKKGEQIRGALVEDIKENKVILQYKDQRVELVQ